MGELDRKNRFLSSMNVIDFQSPLQSVFLLDINLFVKVEETTSWDDSSSEDRTSARSSEV